MIVLPIVGRELRVASRRRSTFWVRVGAALVALVIGAGFFVMALLPSFGMGANFGSALFAVLTWLTLFAVLSAGLFFTSDCLSEEKREGTMGFLFLTDLSGYDVVLGKLLATSLRGFYALLAVFPILGVTLMMGGVTGTQFWKTALALVNALFLSLAAGLFVSAISRESQKALGATLLLLVLLAAAGPIADGILAWRSQRTFEPMLSLASPGYLFAIAGAWGRAPYWSTLLVNQIIAWTLLGLSCAVLPRTWQEKAATTSRGSWAYTWKFGGAKYRIALREKLVNINPILWLACRERWQAIALWILAVLMAGGALATAAFSDASGGGWMLWNYVGGAVTLALYLGIASQACRFFVEAKRNGLIETLLCTPLTAKQIVQGQWRGLLRMFGLAVMVYLAAQLLGTIMMHTTWSRLMAAATATPPPAAVPGPGTNTPGATNPSVIITTTTTAPTTTTTVTVSTGTWPNTVVTVAISVAATITTAANLVALIWFGMWMALTSKTANLATLKTIVFVQIIPWFGVTFASWMLVPLLLLPQLMKAVPTAPTMTALWYPLLTSAVATLLYLAKDIGFVLWTRSKLYGDLRARATRAAAPVHIAPLAVPPRLPG